MRFERFFLDEALPPVGAEARLESEEARHLGSVLRKVEGDEVVLFDGAGEEARARVLAVEKRSVRLSIVECRRGLYEAPFALRLAVGLPRGGAAEDVLRRAIDIGATDIIPLVTQRAVHRSDKKDGRRREERFRRMAIASMKTSGRNLMPQLHSACQPAALEVSSADYAVFGDLGSSVIPLIDDWMKQPLGPSLLAIGPEGGWTVEEEESLRALGIQGRSLGPVVLRVESAVAVGLGILAARSN